MGLTHGGFSIFFYSLLEIVGLHYILGFFQCVNLRKTFYYVGFIGQKMLQSQAFTKCLINTVTGWMDI